MGLHIRHGLFALSLITVASVAAVAAGGSYTITTLVDYTETRPDGNIPWSTNGTPALDGNYVLFMTLNLQGILDAIWSFDTRTMTPTKLAGLSTPVPHGTGDFTGFGLFFADDNPSPTVGGGYAAFYGADADGVHGLYTVSEKGGKISRVVTTATLAPDDHEAFTYFTQARLNGTKIVFYGMTSGIAGIYEANLDGTGLTTVIDIDTHLGARGYGHGKGYYNYYSTPQIGKSQVTFYATGVGNPSTYPNEIFTRVGNGYPGVADNLTPLGDDPAGLGHTEIGGFSAAVENSDVAIEAWDGFYYGIFEPSGGISRIAKRLVSSTERVPGTKDTFASCNPPGTPNPSSCFFGFSFDSTGLVLLSHKIFYAVLL